MESRRLADLEDKVSALMQRFALPGGSNIVSPSSTNLVEVNVGGTIFTTFVSTLTKHPSSMLAAMFSGRHPLVRDKEGRPFLDRNPELFKLILEYLRCV